MGANIGTTVTSWILSLSGIQGTAFGFNSVPANFTPVLALIGIVFTMAAKSDSKKNIGNILLGFAVLMFGMETMSAAVEPLKDVEAFYKHTYNVPKSYFRCACRCCFNGCYTIVICICRYTSGTFFYG